MKKVIIVHRWEGSAEADWYPWLKNELEKKGYKVNVLEMPNPETPVIEEWVGYLKDSIGEVDENTVLIGHSVGCQTILRFLEQANDEVKVGKVLLVAPWLNLVNLSGPEEEEIAKPWLETPIDFQKVKDKSDKFIAWFSDNDPWVPASDAKLFESKLGANVFIEKSEGHFTEEDSVVELPELLEVL
jgi:hypothetical protein